MARVIVPSLPQPTLFPPEYATPIDPKQQVDRLPGIDAPCMCGRTDCRWPWCKPDNERNEQ